MRAGRNPRTGEYELYLDEYEVLELKEMIRGAKLTHRRTFHKLLSEL